MQARFTESAFGRLSYMAEKLLSVDGCLILM